MLSVPAVWHGQVWRLATFALLETEALTLIVSCLMLYWFGGDLAQFWGSRRFVALFFGLAATAGAATCLVGWPWTRVAMATFAGAAPTDRSFDTRRL